MNEGVQNIHLFFKPSLSSHFIKHFIKNSGSPVLNVVHQQDLTFFKVKLDSKVDRERLVRIELKQYENMDRAERQLIKSVERVERKEIK